MSRRKPGCVILDMTSTKFLRAEAPSPGADGRRRDGRSFRLQARFSNRLDATLVRGYSGVLSSPLFGQPTGYRRGRTVRLSMCVDS